MSVEITSVFWYYTIAIVILTLCGVYCLLATQSLIRALLGVEILVKAATLLIILVGRVTGCNGLAQSLVITLIVIEVVLMVIAGGIIFWIFRHTNDINTKDIMELKG